MNEKEIKQDIADLKKAISSPATPEDKKILFQNKVEELEKKLESASKKNDDFYTAVSKKTEAKSKTTQSKIIPIKKKTSGKIPMKSIEIFWAEGNQSNYPKFPQTYTSWSEANNRAIRPVYADLVKADGGYNKVKFKVTWEDGETYDGMLDVSEKEDNPTTSNNVIGQHIKDFLTWVITQSDYGSGQKYIAQRDLEKYDLGLTTKTSEKRTKSKTAPNTIKLRPLKEIKEKEAPKKKMGVPRKKSEIDDLEYDCDELIEKEKKRKANAKKRASMPKKSPATKNKEKLEGVLDNVKERAEKGDITKAELIKLIAECKALLKLLENKLSKM